MGWINWARARQPFALVIDSFDAHEPWDAPRRLIDLYGPARAPGGGAIQPFATPAARASGWTSRSGCCAGCGSSTPPR